MTWKDRIANQYIMQSSRNGDISCKVTEDQLKLPGQEAEEQCNMHMCKKVRNKYKQ